MKKGKELLINLIYCEIHCKSYSKQAPTVPALYAAPVDMNLQVCFMRQKVQDCFLSNLLF